MIVPSQTINDLVIYTTILQALNCDENYSNWMNMKILAAARHPGPGESIGPTVKELRKQGHQVVLIGVNSVTPETKHLGGSATVFNDLNIDHVDLCLDIGYKGNIVNIPEIYAQQLITKYKPDVILVGTSHDKTGLERDIEAVLVSTGTKLSLRTIQIVEAWGCWYPKQGLELASFYAHIDKLSAQISLSRGMPEECIVITGHPGLDQYSCKNDKKPNGLIKANLGIDPKRRLVTYHSQAEIFPGAPSIEKTLSWVISNLQHDDLFIFTRHPRDTKDYTLLLKQAGKKLLEPNLTNQQILEISDLSITHYSTMGVKSALLNIPTINIILDNDRINFDDSNGDYPVTILGGNYEANSKQDVEYLMSQNLPGVAKHLKSALNIDGKSAKRIAQLVTMNG